MSETTEAPIYNVLFICTGNSCRSIMAESILRQDGAGKFRAFSAGANPRGEVNPRTLATLESFGYPTDDLRSKSWVEFGAEGAPEMDFIFTLCDDAAGEACPDWTGHPSTAHWGIEDPAKAEGREFELETVFNASFRHLKNRIDAFVALPLIGIDAMALHHHLQEIGRMEGSTAPKTAA